MAAKPSTLPRWANVGGDIVVPPNGKQDVGWLPPEKPPAQYFNWMQNLNFQWLQYLSDGALSGNHSIDGNLDVDGDLAILGTLLAGPINAGNTQVSGNLSVSGDIESNLELIPGASVIVSGTGRVRRGERTRAIPAAAGNPVTAGGGFISTGAWQSANAADIFEIPLIVDETERIKRVRARVDPFNTGAVTMTVRRRNADGFFTSIGSATSSGTTLQTIDVTGLTEVVTGDERTYVARFEAGQAGDLVFGVILTTDVP